MDEKDGRRKRVPAGTFGGSGSEPPASSEAEAPPQRESSPDPGDPNARRRHTSTIVGHPAVGAVHAPVAVAPVLAPPKWRGAKAYLEGDEPQPRISSIPTPPVVSASAAAPASRVTTKIGPPNGNETTPLPAVDSEAIGDAIQEMLDGQASIRMEVEESSADAVGDAAGDAVMEELPLEELASDELFEQLASPSPPPPPPPIASAPPAARSEPQPLAKIALRAERVPTLDAQAARSNGAVVEIPPTPPAQASRGEAPATRSPRPASPASGGVSASSLAPVEQRAKSDRARPDLGLALVAAMLAVGFGGWFFTRGGYPGPARGLVERQQVATTTPPPAQPSPPPPAQAPSSTVQPAAPAALQSAKPPAATVSVPTSSSAQAQDTRGQKVLAKHVRSPQGKPPSPESEQTPTAPSAEPPVAYETVLKVTPHNGLGETPDVPSRDNVVAALTPLRAAVAECAHGQHGTAQLDVTVGSSGFVTQAIVGGDFAGTPEGSCIARVARSAQFVPFKKPRFRVIYPFSF
jgi:hypothetical protein